MAPELVRSEESYLERTQSTDVYAFGMVIFEIFSGKFPFANIQDTVDVIGQISSGVRPERPERPAEATEVGLTDEMWKIAEDCWQADRDRRPQIAEVLLPLGLIYVSGLQARNQIT